MKTKYLLLAISCLMLCLLACKKDGQSLSVYKGTPLTFADTHGYTTGITTTDTITPGAVITGVWKLVSDSTFRGAGSTNNAYNYQGQAADSFDFRTDGYVYTKEDGVLDTFSYHLLADTSLYMANITANSVPKNFHISTFTAHKFVGATPIFASPGGEFGRKICLSR